MYAYDFYVVTCPLIPKKRFLKGALKGVLEGCLILLKDSGLNSEFLHEYFTCACCKQAHLNLSSISLERLIGFINKMLLRSNMLLDKNVILSPLTFII